MSNLFSNYYTFFRPSEIRPCLLSYTYWWSRSPVFVLGNMQLTDGTYICLFNYNDKRLAKRCYNFYSSFDDIHLRMIIVNGGHDKFNISFIVAGDMFRDQPIWWMFSQFNVFAISEYEVV